MGTEDKKRSLCDVCLAMFKIGLIGFGGGNALIPVIEKTAVQEKKLLTKEEYDIDVMAASVTPGALPVEIAGGIGRRIAGLKGLILGASSMALPGVIMTIVCLVMIAQISPKLLQQVGFVMIGVSGFICCLLTSYIISTVHSMKKENQYYLCLAMILIVVILICDKNLFRVLPGGMSPVLALSTVTVFKMAFFVVFYTRCLFNKVNFSVLVCICILYVLVRSSSHIIFCAGLGTGLECCMLALSLYGLRRELVNSIDDRESSVLQQAVKDTLLSVVLTALLVLLVSCLTVEVVPFAVNGALSSIMSFGGGDAYLTVADGLFVQEGFISEDDFYSYLVPIVNVLPGSILCKTLSGIGFFLGNRVTGSAVGGVAVAIVGFVVSVVCSCGVFALAYAGYERFGYLRVFQEIKRWIRPVVSGLLVNVMLALIFQVKKIDVTASAHGMLLLTMFVIYLMDLYLSSQGRLSNGSIAVLSIGMSLIICNLVMMAVVF